ncbi:MAG: Glu/Leu/Phe/Val family dehydrogenase [Promethearchaeota archaeon]
MSSLLQDQVKRFTKFGKKLEISKETIEFFCHPLRTTKVNFPIKLDMGHIDFYQGYRVQHSNTLGPTLGGLIISERYQVEDLHAIAMIMSIQAALMGIPFGGSCGLIVGDPKKLSDGELENLVRRYTFSILNVIGPTQDIICPDLNTNSTTMSWVADTYSMSLGKAPLRVCTGKPKNIGGIFGRDQGIGLGISYILHELARTEFEEIQNHKVAIQGLGYVGRNFFRAVDELGAIVVAVSDSSGGIYNPNGINCEEIIEYKEQHGSIKGFTGGQPISNDDLLTLSCDVLIPCAIPNVITEDIAYKVQCRRIIEGANGAITLNADHVLWQRDIPVIPDVLANAGGMLISYFEWAQNFTDHAWDIETVKMEMKKLITRSFHKVYDLRVKEDITFREAAYMIAIEKLDKAHQMRGVYP